jgi:hypothetical protein
MMDEHVMLGDVKHLPCDGGDPSLPLRMTC